MTLQLYKCLMNCHLKFTESSIDVIVFFVEFVRLGNIGLKTNLKLKQDKQDWFKMALMDISYKCQSKVAVSAIE